MTTPKQLKPFPDRASWPRTDFQSLDGSTLSIIDEVGFSRAQADAAMERLRLAVEALTAVGYAGPLVIADIQAKVCKDALSAIGDIP